MDFSDAWYNAQNLDTLQLEVKFTIVLTIPLNRKISFPLNMVFLSILSGTPMLQPGYVQEILTYLPLQFLTLLNRESMEVNRAVTN